MKVHESGEDYLETILALKQKNGSVRSIDIARELSFSRPSISRAMSLLKNAGYITMEQNGRIDLTEKGMTSALEVYERHNLLTQWLISIGVSPETADSDACRIEHVISYETFEHIKSTYNLKP